MKNWTREQILLDAKDNNVQYVRLQFTDMLGTIKNVELPVRNLEKALSNEILFDGSSILGFVRINEADMYLYPDLNTWLIMTWEDSPYGTVARLVCDVYTSKREPFEGDPRFILKRNLKEAHTLGFDKFNVGVEPEFFLFKLDDEGKPTLEFSDKGGYFDLSPIDFSEDVRRDIVLELTRMGFNMEVSHHEVAFGQHEVNFEYDNALEACDNIQTFKIVVKNVARRHGYHATFMPKPVAGINGSGMHTNVSLAKGDINTFYDPKTENMLSETALKFIAGVMKHAEEFCFITNPTVNSYKRLVPGYEAPVYVSWSDVNRSTMIRIPASKGRATRIEVRSVDPSANPYLAISAVLASGLDGIKSDLPIPSPVRTNLFKVSDLERKRMKIAYLPGSLEEALKNFSSSKFMKTVIGEDLFPKLIEAKQKEWDDYKQTVTEWEIKRYMDLI